MLLNFIISYFWYLQQKSLLTLLFKCVLKEGYGGVVLLSLIRWTQTSQEERTLTLISEFAYGIKGEWMALKESETASNTVLYQNAWDFLSVSEQKGVAKL